MKRLLAAGLILAATACASHSKPQAGSGKVAIVQIDDVTFGSKDKNLHQYPLPATMVTEVADKLRSAGAKVVVVDLAHTDPTSVAVNTVQEYTGKIIESGSIERDPKTGQMKLDLPEDKIVQVKTERGDSVQEHIPTFADNLSFSQAYRQTPDQLRPTVAGKIVYLGCTRCKGDDVVESLGNYPALFAHARLADQLVTKSLAPSSD